MSESDEKTSSKKNTCSSVFSANLESDPKDKDTFCNSVHTEINSLSNLLMCLFGTWWLSVCHHHPTSMSLLSERRAGHLCLNDATGFAGPFLTCLLITPSGHEESQSKVRPLDQCCPTGDLLSVWQSGVLSSGRHEETHEKLPCSLETQIWHWGGKRRAMGFFWGQPSVCDLLSVRLMQIRSF